MSSHSPLRYDNEKDRTYGVAGMAIAMVLWDGEEYLASVSIDSPVGSSVTFTPAFGFSGNPRMTASLAWRELVSQFELSTAMLMGNAVCRAYVHKSSPMTSATALALQNMIREHGREMCSLDDDETDSIYNRTRSYLDRIFTHSGVADIAHNFAATLGKRRSLTAGEVIDLLDALRRL